MRAPLLRAVIVAAKQQLICASTGFMSQPEPSFTEPSDERELYGEPGNTL